MENVVIILSDLDREAEDLRVSYTTLRKSEGNAYFHPSYNMATPAAFQEKDQQ